MRLRPEIAACEPFATAMACRRKGVVSSNSFFTGSGSDLWRVSDLAMQQRQHLFDSRRVGTIFSVADDIFPDSATWRQEAVGVYWTPSGLPDNAHPFQKRYAREGSPRESSKMLQLRAHRSELTYEATLAPSLAALIDTPGKLASALISEFDPLDVSLSDVSLDEGPLEDRGLSCEVEKLDASILLRADRVEIRFFAIDETHSEATAQIMQGVWKAMASTSPEIAAKSHSLLFEMDCELATGSYRGALELFCKPHENLPKGTETAVVYYLPRDRSQGFLDSSFVLNRSAEVDGGVLLAATLVFEGKHSGPGGLVEEGRARLKGLLSSLDITLMKNLPRGS